MTASHPAAAEPGPRCPRCEAVLAPDAPAGLCPACLVSAHFGTEADLSEPAATGAPTPTIEDIAPHFPQLEILSCLGRGGMGVVYKARQKSLGRLVALKLLAPERGSDPAFAERFAREAQTLARLDHPHIVTIHDFGRAGGCFYLLMEFVDGVTLRHLIHGGRLAAREALAIVPQICDALQFAHDHGVVHRDIKPENILLDRRGHAKVADFGLAKLVGPDGEPAAATGDATVGASAEFTEAGKVMGTPRYMAPEQREHPAEVDHRADIYALGVVLYQMLTGELPDEKHLQPPSRRVRLDVRLDEIVLRALEHEPSRRYASATEFKTRVETVSPPPAPPPPFPPPPATAPSPATPASPASPESTTAPGPAERVKAPAIAMMAAGIANLAVLVLGLFAVALALTVLSGGTGLAAVAGIAGSSSIRFFGAPFVVAGALGMVAALIIAAWMLAHVAAFTYLIVAARRMRALRRHRSACVGAWILIVTGGFGLLFSGASASAFTSFWSLAELGIGIWALVVLLRPEVRSAFDHGHNPPTAPTSANPSASGSASVPVSPPLSPATSSVITPARRVATPATGLMIAAGLQMLLLGALAGMFLGGVSFEHEGGKETLRIALGGYTRTESITPGDGIPPLWYSLTPPVLLGGLALAALTFAGAWRMRRLRGHRLALLGALLAVFTAPGLGLGVVFGLWALVALLRREVHAAFDEGAPARRVTGLLVASTTAAGLLILFAAVVAATVATRQSARKAWAQSPRAAPPSPLPAPAATLPALPEGGLDLSPHWTRVFPADTASGFGLTTLRGLHVFDGQPPFLVGGQVVLVGQRLVGNLEPSAPPKPLPVALELPVGRTFADLHLLHATFWSDPVGVEVATLRFRYTDGETRSIPLRYGVHVLDWQRLPSETFEWLSDPASALVWRGTGAPGQHSTARAIATTVPNPRPDVPVASMEWISTRSIASYALLAATISKVPAQDQAPVELAQ